MNMRSDGFKVFLGVLGGMVAIVVFGLLLSYAPELARAPVPTPTPGGVAISRYRTISNATLTDHDNRPMSLGALRGKPTLIAFGYTFCPDVCPLTMADLRRVKRELGEAGDRVNFVFITVDPQRDTPEVIRRYVKAFDPAFIGLTGDEATLKKLIYEFDGLFEKQPPQSGNPNSYIVAHTSFIYLLDAQGQWRMKYSFGTPVEVIARDVQAMLQESARRG
ncbi:MAG: SCO family protein [Thermoflexales bacterium]|nr:SCO family protein [Thermoflexales bacterium]MDW8350365.1 SCO family protein [Anaerolineae bacterium]